MVCAGDVATGSTGRSNTDLEIGCFIDLATGLVLFFANGRELPTAYQVTKQSIYFNFHRLFMFYTNSIQYI